MMCFNFSRNPWLAKNSVIRIGSGPQGVQDQLWAQTGTVVYQSLQGWGLHNLSVPLFGSPHGDKFWGRCPIWNSCFKLHIFCLILLACITVGTSFCLDDLAGTGKLLYLPPNHFSRLKMPPCLSVGPVLQPQTIVHGGIRLMSFTPRVHCWLMCISLLSKIPSPFLQIFFPPSWSTACPSPCRKCRLRS